MCSSPSAPTIQAAAAAPPLETPSALALPDSSRPLNLSQLRVSNQNGLKLPQPASPLTIPKQGT